MIVATLLNGRRFQQTETASNAWLINGATPVKNIKIAGNTSNAWVKIVFWGDYTIDYINMGVSISTLPDDIPEGMSPSNFYNPLLDQ